MNSKNMFQKLFKKSAAFKIGIPRNGCRMSKSLSPVIIHEALDATANSRNLLSLGSRQSTMLSTGEKKTAFRAIRCIALHFSSSFKKYLSNFFLNKTSTSSSIVAFEKANFPNITARSIALESVVPPIREALTKLFVSNKKNSFIFQNSIKNFFCKSTLFHCTAKLIQVLEKIFFGISKFFCQCNIHLLRNSISAFLRQQPPFFSSLFIHFNYNPFHNFSFLFFSKIQKLSP